MDKVRVEEAAGMVLCHDVTRIVPGESKGRAFKKGHIITEEDIPEFLKLGKAHIYVQDVDGGVHENDAALRIARAAAGKGLALSRPCEGKVSLTAGIDGLLKININALDRINDFRDIMFATRHANHRVSAGTVLAGTRIIPLSIGEEKIAAVENICNDAFPVIEVKPFYRLKAGMVTTGSEIFKGLVKDGFGPVVRKKFNELGTRVFRQVLVPDDTGMTVKAIHGLLDEGARIIAVTGGMSVDPDDLTPASIKAAGGRIVTYGAPVLPGAMFLLAYIGDVPVIGLPGCVMYHSTSIFDLVVPRLLAGEILEKKDFSRMGHGGLCLNCSRCRYPECSFGK
ncbi:MAG: molybdopterin-binding protein [Desulfobacterales bacterium]|nr:molybdopterin-binding protein [Desulfobacterales bacterium]